MTQEETPVAKEILQRISCCEAAISAAKLNILKYEFLKAEKEFALISTNSKAYKDFIEFKRKNNIQYDKYDRAPIYCHGNRKNDFLDNLISDEQKFIKEQETAISLL